MSLYEITLPVIFNLHVQTCIGVRFVLRLRLCNEAKHVQERLIHKKRRSYFLKLLMYTDD